MPVSSPAIWREALLAVAPVSSPANDGDHRSPLQPPHLCYDFANMDAKNKLYFGDNLKILREYVPDASVDLIYLDPPFNSSATYNVLFKEKSGEESAAQITASSVAPIYDRRRAQRRKRTGDHRSPLQQESEAVYRKIVERGPRKLADLMQALLAFLGRNDMMAPDKIW